MGSTIQLKTTPIKEIIFGISFSEPIDIAVTDKFFNDAIATKKFNQKNRLQIEAGIGDGNEKVFSNNINQYILKSPDEEKIIQIRQGLFTFHKLKEYEHFEKLISELQKLWMEFIKYTGKLTVQNISLRYLNFIDRKENETINQLVTISVNQPFGENLNTEFVKLQFKYDPVPEIFVNITSTNATDKKKKQKGIILDIMLNRKLDNLQEYKEVFDKFNEMRVVKNDLFFKSITQYTQNKYNHE